MIKHIPLSNDQKEIDDWRRAVLQYVQTCEDTISALSSQLTSLTSAINAVGEDGEPVDLSSYYNKFQIDAILNAATEIPINQKGDLLTRNSTQNMRFPVGTDGQIIKAASGQQVGLEWTDPDYYTQDEVDTILDDYYTSDEVDTLISGVSGSDVIINYGQNDHGTYATVNGVTSTGSVVTYYTGYTTYFHMVGFRVYVNDTTPEVHINPTTGYVTSTASSTGWLKWMAISIKN